MQTTRLITLLQTLSETEIRQFDRWVHSPYVHQHEDTIRFWEELKRDNVSGEGIAEWANVLFERLYPGEPYRDEQMRTLRKYLLKLLLDFLAQEQFQQDKVMQQHYRLKALQDRPVDVLFAQQMRIGTEKLTQIPFQDTSYYLRAYLLKHVELEYSVQKEPRHSLRSLEELTLYLDQLYFAEKLKLLSAGQNFANLVGSPLDTLLLRKEILAEISRSYDSQPPLIQGYYQLYQALQHTGSVQLEAYKALRHILAHHGEIFSREDRINFYNSAINLANGFYRQGEEKYLREMLTIYREMLDQKLLHTQGELNSHQFKNVVTLALRLGEYQWAEAFIEKHHTELPEIEQQGVYRYNLANLYSSQQRYREALRNLMHMEFLDPFYKISYKLLQLKIYYECDEIEALLSLAQTFRTFIRRQKQLPSSRKLAYTNFARFTRALFMVKLGKKRNLQDIRSEIEQANALIEKGWLKSKIAELEKGLAV